MRDGDQLVLEPVVDLARPQAKSSASYLAAPILSVCDGLLDRYCATGGVHQSAGVLFPLSHRQHDCYRYGEPVQFSVE